MFVFVMLSCLLLAALWSPAGKGLTSWLSCVLCFLVFVSLSHLVSRILIVSIPDLCLPLYLEHSCKTYMKTKVKGQSISQYFKKAAYVCLKRKGPLTL